MSQKKILKFVSLVFYVFLFLISSCGEKAERDEIRGINGIAKGNVDIAVPLGQRQLFLDDYGVVRIEHLTRTLHQPEKKGAVIRPDRPWESALQTRCAPAWDPKEEVFKLWMITSTTIPGVGGMTYAESKDGMHWTKPILRQMEVDGSLENNFVTIDDDPNLTWPANAIENVVYDPFDPDPSRRYKGLGHCDGREPLISPDGIHWKRLDVPKIPSADESNLSYDQSTNTFIATVKQNGPHGRSVYLSTSKDFEHWIEPELIFHADDIDQERGREHIEARLANPALQQPIYNEPAKYNVDVYNMGVFRYEGLYVGMPAMFHATGPTSDNFDGFHLVQLTCSRDLKTWKRMGDRKTFIGPSPMADGIYDRTQLLPPSRPVVHSDELWFYYTGIKYRAAPENPDPDGSAICLAVLRRDGFISLDAGEREGIVVTKPFKLPGTTLYVNVDAGKGTLRVEVLRKDGKVLATSRTLTGDQLRGRIKWTRGELASFKEKVALRFSMRNTRFYSYWWSD